MRQISLLTLFSLILLLAACSKSTPASRGGTGGTGGSTPGYFFENTEWVGTATLLAREYDQPLDLYFSGDSVVYAYCLFHLNTANGWYEPDSLIGKVTSVASGDNSSLLVSVTYPATNDQQVYTLTTGGGGNGGSTSSSPAEAAAGFSVNVLRAQDKIDSVSRTNWSGHQEYPDQTGPYISYDYPDVQTFSFNYNGTTSYRRSGEDIYLSEADHVTKTVLEVKYWQRSSRILFYGYNENTSHIIPYFGVLAQDQKSMMVDARSSVSPRLPYYGGSSSYDNGPVGQTPVIYPFAN